MDKAHMAPATAGASFMIRTLFEDTQSPGLDQ